MNQNDVLWEVIKRLGVWTVAMLAMLIVRWLLISTIGSEPMTGQGARRFSLVVSGMLAFYLVGFYEACLWVVRGGGYSREDASARAKMLEFLGVVSAQVLPLTVMVTTFGFYTDWPPIGVGVTLGAIGAVVLCCIALYKIANAMIGFQYQSIQQELSAREWVAEVTSGLLHRDRSARRAAAC